jgi:hypothetical protein
MHAVRRHECKKANIGSQAEAAESEKAQETRLPFCHATQSVSSETVVAVPWSAWNVPTILLQSSEARPILLSLLCAASHIAQFLRRDLLNWDLLRAESGNFEDTLKQTLMVPTR